MYGKLLFPSLGIGRHSLSYIISASKEYLMATASPNVPTGQSETLAANLPGMPSFLFDPARAAKYVHSKWFWVGPIVVFSLVSIAAGLLMMPIVQHVLEVAPIPDGVTPERYQRGIAIGTMIQKAAIFLAPV